MSDDQHTRERYRTFWRRLWAGLIDGLVLLPVSWLDSRIWGAGSLPVLRVSWFVFYSFSFVAYSILLHGFFGQTVGKRITRVRVLDVSESALSIRQAILRDSVYLGLILYAVVIDLPTVASGMNPYSADTFRFSHLSIGQLFSLYGSLGWFVLELVTMVWNAKRRAVHDFIAGSVVVRAD